MLDRLTALFQALAPLWEMSITAAYAAAIVIVLRLLLKKRAPKQVLCLLWLVVFARLLLPVSLESPLSIVPDALPGQQETLSEHNSSVLPQNPAQNQAGNGSITPTVNDPVEPSLAVPEGVAPAASAPETPAIFPWQAVLAGIWLAGASAMMGSALASYLRLRRRLFDAIRAKDGAWEHPAVDSPFILGMLRPRIYLPVGLVGRPRKFILCHERAHLRRFDHIVKPVCWIALALHWFNPLVWAAFILMSRDIESACDEAVIRRLGSSVKADYSTTLLALATGRRAPSPCPLAFDEGDARGRIQNVLRYRRPALWVIVVSVIAAALAAVCLLTDPVAAQNPEGGLQQGPGASQGPENSPGITQAPVNLAGTLLDPWMKEVLDGERQFISAYSQYAEGDGRTYSIRDLRTFYYGDDQFPDAVVEAGRLAVIDLDRDGVNEMVIWPEGSNEYLYSVVGYVILHREGDEIYGYNPVYRAFGNLKSDGTFSWSSGAPWNGFATLTFEPGEVVLHETTYHKPAENGIDQLYFVDGRKATQEEYYAAADAQFAKPDAIWYAYTDGVLSPWLPNNMELTGQTAAVDAAAIDDIDAAAPLDAPVVSLITSVPKNPDEWYKVAELPDDMIWVYSRNFGTQTLIRWGGDFGTSYRVFDQTAHEFSGETPPKLKKLDNFDGIYGPLAVIYHLAAGKDQLVVYDLDKADPVVYIHDWKPLADDFNANYSFRNDNGRLTLTYQYQGQTTENPLDKDFSEFLQNGMTLRAGSNFDYFFDTENNGDIVILLSVECFTGDNQIPTGYLYPISWTLRFNGAGFDIVPGSCHFHIITNE